MRSTPCDARVHVHLCVRAVLSLCVFYVCGRMCACAGVYCTSVAPSVMRECVCVCVYVRVCVCVCVCVCVFACVSASFCKQTGS